MKRLLALAISVAIAMSVMQSSQAVTKVFKNCTELNKVYPGGVAMPGAINSGGITKKAPKYNKALYLANKKSDRDKDGIACEK
jgi:opacity protein-like surface antigen